VRRREGDARATGSRRFLVGGRLILFDVDPHILVAGFITVLVLFALSMKILVKYSL
jgi:hypothetical protein